ncbi:MAG TPA: DUF167 domain-containing protein [Acidimicrobiia bacterium]|nr:DUF167 domain-containing protein [Acidimicrobiia bacterium]
MDADPLARIVERRGDDVIVAVHVQPRAGTTALSGRHGDAVTLRVQAPAVEGRATEAARRLLAEVLGVSPTRVALESGERSRRKRFRVQGCAAQPVRDAIGAALEAIEASRRARR